MGCIQSKLIHRQDESEDEYVFDSLDESQSSGFDKLSLVDSKSIENFSDVRSLPEKMNIGNDYHVATTERIVSTSNDNDEKSSDDIMTERVQLIRDIADLQMAELRMARERFHRTIIQRDARKVVALLKRHSFTEDTQIDEENESSAKKVAIWQCEEQEQMKKEKEYENEHEEGKCHYKDTDVPELSYFQDIIASQMEELRDARERLHRCIIKRDARRIVEELMGQSVSDTEEEEEEVEDEKEKSGVEEKENKEAEDQDEGEEEESDKENEDEEEDNEDDEEDEEDKEGEEEDDDEDDKDDDEDEEDAKNDENYDRGPQDVEKEEDKEKEEEGDEEDGKSDEKEIDGKDEMRQQQDQCYHGETDVPDFNYFQKIVQAEIEELRAARNRIHGCVVRRDAMIVVEELRGQSASDTEEEKYTDTDVIGMKRGI